MAKTDQNGPKSTEMGQNRTKSGFRQKNFLFRSRRFRGIWKKKTGIVPESARLEASKNTVLELKGGGGWFVRAGDRLKSKNWPSLAVFYQTGLQVVGSPYCPKVNLRFLSRYQLLEKFGNRCGIASTRGVQICYFRGQRAKKTKKI